MKTLLTTLAIGLVLANSPAAAQDEAYSLESRAAIGAHHLCSGLWVVGSVTKRTPVQVLGQDIAPFRDFSWDDRFTFHVSETDKRSTVSGPGIPSRIAKFNGDQGCAILPRGETGIHFKPVVVPRNLPDAATQPWPTGDANAEAGSQTPASSPRSTGASSRRHTTLARSSSCIRARSSASATRRGGPRTRRKSAGRRARASPRR